MPNTRRECLHLLGATLAGAVLDPALRADSAGLGMPGRYRGRVIAVENQKSIRRDKFQAEPIRLMIGRGMCALTGASTPEDAWKQFFQPGDIVGVKLNLIGNPAPSFDFPKTVGSPELVLAVIDGIRSTGVKPSEIIVYERYRAPFAKAGVEKWLPPGVRTENAAEAYDHIQQGMDGYDPDHYVDLPFVWPEQDPQREHSRRSYAAQFISRHVTKMVNLPILKDHDAAGVSLALKNMSHGLVNNVSRSHPDPATNRIAEFIPAVLSMPVIREKAVLHILDGLRGIFQGGPSLQSEELCWEHKTIYFATDPVALDRVGWSVIDARRAKARLAPLAEAKPDGRFTSFQQRRPDHVIACGKLGLGEWDLDKIDLQKSTI